MSKVPAQFSECQTIYSSKKFVRTEDVQCSVVFALGNLLGWEQPVDITLPNIIIQY